MVVRPGTGWPGDNATSRTVVAHDVGEVRALAGSASALSELSARVSVCRACPRLVAWREEVARTKRRAFADQEYWGRPVPGFGVDRPSIVVIGLAPAAHGANRTGRNFTGDRSGEWLYAALYRCGLANQPTAVAADDGLALVGTRIVASVRCAPPANRPTPEERDTCRLWLVRELRLVWPGVRSVVVLGGFAWANLWPGLRMAGVSVPDRVPLVRARAGGPSGWSHGARLLPRQSAEHVHRTADRADARRRARSRGDAGGWPGCGGGLTVRVIDAEAVAALGWAAAIDAIRAAIVSDSATGVPPRTVVDVRAGQLLLMPAAVDRYAGVKVVSIAPDNPVRGLPRVQGAYLLFDATTLQVAAVLDGVALTTLRTAAVSALAVDRLARPEEARLVVFGCGPQARGHIEALSQVRPIRQVTIVEPERQSGRSPGPALCGGRRPRVGRPPGSRGGSRHRGVRHHRADPGVRLDDTSSARCRRGYRIA